MLFLKFMKNGEIIMTIKEKSTFIKNNIGFPLNNAINNLNACKESKDKLMNMFNNIRKKHRDITLSTGIYKDNIYEDFVEYILLVSLIYSIYKK